MDWATEAYHLECEYREENIGRGTVKMSDAGMAIQAKTIILCAGEYKEEVAIASLSSRGAARSVARR